MSNMSTKKGKVLRRRKRKKMRKNTIQRRSANEDREKVFKLGLNPCNIQNGSCSLTLLFHRSRRHLHLHFGQKSTESGCLVGVA